MIETVKLGAAVLLVSAAMCTPMACDAGAGGAGGTASASIHSPWTLGPVATCEQLGLVTVRLHASMEGADPVTRTEACVSDAREGAIFIEDLEPGAWTLTVEGLDADGSVTHRGEITPEIVVAAGEQGATEEILLLLRPADVIVDWSVGGKCGSAGIVDVLVELYDEHGRPLDLVGPLLVDCDASFEDPRDGLERTGVLFPHVPAEPGVTALVRGFDAGGSAIWRGDEGPLDLFPGRLTELLVELSPCSGDPPDCD